MRGGGKRREGSEEQETPKRMRKQKFSTTSCKGSLMDETYSAMIEFLNFCSLLAFKNSKADLFNRWNLESTLPEAIDRTHRGNVPLDAFVNCENRQECYASDKVALVVSPFSLTCTYSSLF